MQALKVYVSIKQVFVGAISKVLGRTVEKHSEGPDYPFHKNSF